ncbi:MAG: TSUP family transporter [Steroidobacteraceae bacterium]
MTRALRALLGALAVAVVGITAYLTPAVSSITRVVLGLLAVVTFWYAWRWPQLEQRLAAAEESARAGRPDPLPARPERPGLFDLAVGFVTNFFDTLGIGNFAPTTAALKFTRRIPDEDIPGALNVGHAFPVLTEALILIAAIAVDPRLLIAMIVASMLGAWAGAGVVARMPRRAIQIAMGTALTIAAALFITTRPAGGSATTLAVTPFLVAVVGNFALGALMTLGIGLYAPCLIMLSLLGLNPRAVFPIMMGSCAFLMPIGGMRFVRTRRYNASVALGFAIAGPPAVLIAGYLVKTMPIMWLSRLVACVVLYAAVMMLTSAMRRAPASDRETEREPDAAARSSGAGE